MLEPVRVSHERMPVWCWFGNKICPVNLFPERDGDQGTRWYQSSCVNCGNAYQSFEEALMGFAEVARFAGINQCYINGDEFVTPVDTAIRILTLQKEAFVRQITVAKGELTKRL